MNLFISGVHFDTAFNLTSSDRFPIAITNNIIKAQNKIKSLLINDLFINTLSLTLADDHLLHLPDDLDIFNNVTIPGSNQDQKQLVHRLVNIPNALSLNKSTLLL